MATASADAQIIPGGGVRFAVEHRHFGGDKGPAIRVLGDVNGVEVQLLRFDCFENDPHYHYDPDGRNVVLHMNPEFDTASWSADHIERNLKVMVKLAGYPEVAERIDMTVVSEAMPAMWRALRGDSVRGE